jgi:hypothetical protein
MGGLFLAPQCTLEVGYMLGLQPLLLTSVTFTFPNWLFTGPTLVGLLIGLVVGFLLGRVAR